MAQICQIWREMAFGMTCRFSPVCKSGIMKLNLQVLRGCGNRQSKGDYR